MVKIYQWNISHAPGVKNQSNTRKWARNTTIISDNAIIVVLIGLILRPIELSSKNRINPAPPDGMGAEPLLLFFRLDDWLDDII